MGIPFTSISVYTAGPVVGGMELGGIGFVSLWSLGQFLAGFEDQFPSTPISFLFNSAGTNWLASNV